MNNNSCYDKWITVYVDVSYEGNSTQRHHMVTRMARLRLFLGFDDLTGQIYVKV